MDRVDHQRGGRYRFSKPDGGFNGSVPPCRYGRGPFRQAAGEAVVEQEGLDRFFARSPELYGVGTYDGLILKVNAAWQRTLGFTAEELALTSLWDRVHPEARGACRSAARALARAGAASLAVRMPHKDGSDRWISWNMVVAAGRLFAVGRDVTARRPETALRECETPVDAKRAPRVLLAEGNPDTRHAMALRLAAAGYAVTPASHGQGAVDLALAAQEAGRPFAAILMDVQMPVLDGYEATRTLRGAGYHHPIIAVTAHTSAEDRDECLHLGCDDCIVKPIDWPRLTGLIASYAP